ncbi:MAG: hypothetical protein HF976_03145 [ANME-2 cluster archaeon]|nr:hypothetical protein [ANME-2 cluster archaeon]MBC2700399.1 hypothetical protein [ANME-2 cluster archaeon]MBC2706596.1 hypothetical protein [ANME-2 cluster archaeon]MBC2748038.1 hypothetical protein [ANME-2 cluster archaeon]MBC2762867.1 hypothetical protein [ANME-2 cluster archaeon]
MSKTIRLSKIAINQLDLLPKDMRNRVKKALYALSDTEKSRILDTKKLKGVNGRENVSPSN